MAEWTNVMQRIDKLYHRNETSEGRIQDITNHVSPLVDACQDAEEFLAYALAHGYIDTMGADRAIEIFSELGAAIERARGGIVR